MRLFAYGSRLGLFPGCQIPRLNPRQCAGIPGHGVLFLSHKLGQAKGTMSQWQLKGQVLNYPLGSDLGTPCTLAEGCPAPTVQNLCVIGRGCGEIL